MPSARRFGGGPCTASSSTSRCSCVANVLFLLDDAGSAYGVPLLLMFDAIVVGLVASWHGYAKRLRLDALADLRVTFTSTAVATMAIVAIDALRSSDEPSAYAALRLWLLATVLLAVGRLTTNLVVAWSRSSSRTATTTIIVGAGRVGRLTAIRLLDHPEFGLHPIGFLDAEPMEISGRPLSLPVLGTSANLAHVVATHGVECALVAFSTDSHDEQLDLLDECERLGIRALDRAPPLRARAVAPPGDARRRAPSARAAPHEPAQHPVRGQVRARSPRGASPCSCSSRPFSSPSPSPWPSHSDGRSSIARIVSASTVRGSTCSSSARWSTRPRTRPARRFRPRGRPGRRRGRGSPDARRHVPSAVVARRAPAARRTCSRAR